VKAVVEELITSGLRWVESPEIYDGLDAEEFGPIALSTRGNAHAFASCEEAGKWVDENSEHGDFVIHAVKS
jgi:hypothetical protein